ncbi:MAG TPA: hypothetical protein VGO58_15405 [Chitinophagaceae bacterium]|jgi:hypothetical protein|nr:hypothetical protein [Chitinophagaceae bacterium]
MKDLKILIAGLGVACSLFVSCNKMDREKIAPESIDLSNKATVQLYHATVGVARNYVSVDGKQVTGATLAPGSVFPAASTGIGFSVDGGLRSILVRDTLSTSTQPALNFAEQFGAGKRYTIFMYDSLTTPKQKTVLDDIIVPTDRTARIRFAHFAYSPVAVPNIDVFSKRQNANIFTNVALTDVTPFVTIASALPDTLIVRVAGSGTNIQNYTPPNGNIPAVFPDVQLIVTPTPFRSYTLVFRGGYRTTLTSTASVRTLSLLSH